MNSPEEANISPSLNKWVAKFVEAFNAWLCSVSTLLYTSLVQLPDGLCQLMLTFHAWAKAFSQAQ